MTNTVPVGLIQMSCSDDVEENLEKAYHPGQALPAP